MDIAKLLEEIEDKYADNELEDIRVAAVEEITMLHQRVVEENPSSLDRFLMLSADSIGGVYIPYIFWYKLGEFYDGEEIEAREFLQKLIKSFTLSNFEEVEQKMIKSLLIAYLAKEKEFEIDKIRTLIIDKTHKDVKDYFYKLFNFVEKNHKATVMYCEKFKLLKDYAPNFELLGYPVSKLKDLL
jgi:hypothetical protein